MKKVLFSRPSPILARNFSQQAASLSLLKLLLLPRSLYASRARLLMVLLAARRVRRLVYQVLGPAERRLALLEKLVNCSNDHLRLLGPAKRL